MAPVPIGTVQYAMANDRMLIHYPNPQGKDIYPLSVAMLELRANNQSIDLTARPRDLSLTPDNGSGDMDVLPLSGVMRYFSAVPDPRRFNVTYTLAQLLSGTLMAVLCRCDDYEEVAGWVLARHDWLVQAMGLPVGAVLG